MYGSKEFVDAGGLMSYGADRVDIYRPRDVFSRMRQAGNQA